MNRFGGMIMKIHSHIRLALVATTLFLSVISMGQNRPYSTIDAPRDGFWVVESQPKKRCVVHFYNMDSQLIYQEVLGKRHLNIKRPAVRESLNAVLEQAMRQWAINQKTGNETVPTNQQWLAAEFGGKQE